MDKGRTTVPRLNLLTDDHLDLSIVFAPMFDERFDMFIQVDGHFTAMKLGIRLPAYMRYTNVE